MSFQFVLVNGFKNDILQSQYSDRILWGRNSETIIEEPTICVSDFLRPFANDKIRPWYSAYKIYDNLFKTAVCSRSDLTRAYIRLVFLVSYKPIFVSLEQLENNRVKELIYTLISQFSHWIEPTQGYPFLSQDRFAPTQA
jgi:hypothetical protein